MDCPPHPTSTRSSSVPDSPASARRSNSTRLGLGDYLIIEAGAEPGGTWYWNTYPGIAVDIPSFSYQFSFEQSADWSRTYAKGNELKAYADRCVDKYGLRRKIRFDTKVTAAIFDDESDCWRVELDSGEAITARFLINASGVLTVPNLPDIDGVDSFAGITMHTARWDHGQDLTGKRVAIIGTGASAVQVIPEIAPIVEKLTRVSTDTDLVHAETRRTVARPRQVGDADTGRQGAPADAQPGLRRADVHDLGAVLHRVPAGQARRTDGPGIPEA